MNGLRSPRFSSRKRSAIRHPRHDAFLLRDIEAIAVAIETHPQRIDAPLNGNWAQASRRFDGERVLAFSEFGGTPDAPLMRSPGVRWS